MTKIKLVAPDWFNFDLDGNRPADFGVEAPSKEEAKAVVVRMGCLPIFTRTRADSRAVSYARWTRGGGNASIAKAFANGGGAKSANNPTNPTL